jgi:hypothetical protein
VAVWKRRFEALYAKFFTHEGRCRECGYRQTDHDSLAHHANCPVGRLLEGW